MTEPLSVARIAELTESIGRQASSAAPKRALQLLDELNCLAEDLIGRRDHGAGQQKIDIQRLVVQLRPLAQENG